MQQACRRRIHGEHRQLLGISTARQDHQPRGIDHHGAAARAVQREHSRGTNIEWPAPVHQRVPDRGRVGRRLDEGELFNMYREVPSITDKAAWALEVALDVEQLVYEVNTFLNAASMIRLEASAVQQKIGIRM